MAQDLTDVLCTAGKQSVVLPLFPFHFHSPISPFSFLPPHFPLSLFSWQCPSLIFSLPLCSLSFPLYPFSYLPHPFFPLSLFSSHCSSPSILLPLSCSKGSVFYFSLSVCSFPTAPPTVPFLFVHSPLYPLLYFSLFRSPFQSVPFHFPTSHFPLPMFLFHLFLPQSIPSHFFIDLIFSISLLPSH